MIEEINIENLIYEIRGKQVMVDSDLARLYDCKNGTKDINKAVNRNIDRFPNDFYFELTKKECECISRFQNGTLNKVWDNRGTNFKYLPHVFTKEGVAMLATVLRTENAANVSIRIIRTFVSMRKFINENKDIFKRISMVEYEVIECKDKISELFDKFETKKIENQKIFFYGQIYDAYRLIIDLIKEANDRIIIIDNYIDKSILDMLVYKKSKCSITISNKLSLFN
jgi:hypothetical protein